MFDKIVDFVLNIWKEIIPFQIVDQWESGVHLRCGIFYKISTPGINFKLPIIDKIHTCYTITHTLHLDSQTLTTSDSKNVIIRSIIRFNVFDVKKYLLTITNPDGVLIDTTQGIIRTIVNSKKFNELSSINDELTKEVSHTVKDWGIDVEKVTLTDLAQIRTYRLISDKNSVLI